MPLWAVPGQGPQTAQRDSCVLDLVPRPCPVWPHALHGHAYNFALPSNTRASRSLTHPPGSRPRVCPPCTSRGLAQARDHPGFTVHCPRHASPAPPPSHPSSLAARLGFRGMPLSSVCECARAHTHGPPAPIPLSFPCTQQLRPQPQSLGPGQALSRLSINIW